MYSMMTIGRNNELYTWNWLESRSWMFSPHTHTDTQKDNCEVMDILITLTAVIISQCMQMTKHHIQHEYIKFLSIISQ